MHSHRHPPAPLADTASAVPVVTLSRSHDLLRRHPQRLATAVDTDVSTMFGIAPSSYPDARRRIPAATLVAAAAVLASSGSGYTPEKLQKALNLVEQAEAEAQTKAILGGTATPGPRMLTLGECASRLHVCRRTLQNWVASGKLPSKKLGGKYLRVVSDDLEAFIQNMPARPVREGATSRHTASNTNIALTCPV